MTKTEGPFREFTYQIPGSEIEQVQGDASGKDIRYREETIQLDPPCNFILPYNCTLEQLGTFRPFWEWLAKLQQNLKRQKRNKDHRFHAAPFELTQIEVQAVDWFTKDRIGFVKIQTKIQTSASEGNEPDWLPGAVFLRGGSVAVLMIIQGVDASTKQETEKHAIFTVQPRIAAASLAFAEIPAGMLDAGTVMGKAIDEIKEETGLEVQADELTNMTELALQDATDTDWRNPEAGPSGASDGEHLALAMYPSPGACDESMSLLLYQKKIPIDEFNKIDGRLTGLRKEGEKITLKLVPLDDLWKKCSRDGKSLAALYLYERLGRENKLPAMIEVAG